VRTGFSLLHQHQPANISKPPGSNPFLDLTNELNMEMCASFAGGNDIGQVYGGDASGIKGIVQGGRLATFSPDAWYLPGTSDPTGPGAGASRPYTELFQTHE
jgi:hypothetical protein